VEIEHLINELEGRYRRSTPESHALWRRALAHTPHGVANSLHFHDPYPLSLADAHGGYVHDVDGRRLLDLHLGHGVMMAGHADPRITAAITAAAGRGAHTGTLSPVVVDMIELLAARFRLEQVQLCVSGAEATALALRIARAYAGRGAIVKIEGGYHGAHEAVMVSTLPDLELAGDAKAPTPVPWGSTPTRADTHVAPFNDLPALEQVFIDARPAALIIEPVLLNAGFILPEGGYLAGVRELCDRHGVIMVGDEVKSGASLGRSGAFAHFGVTPDLICLGKGIGGGLPLAAVGGRAALMRVVGDDQAPHYATFAANPVACAAGIAALEQVLDADTFAHMESLARRLADGLAGTLAPVGGSPVTLGAKGAVVFGDPPRDYRTLEQGADLRRAYALWLHLIDAGILIAPVEDELQWTICAAHDAQDIDRVIAAAGDFARLLGTDG